MLESFAEHTSLPSQHREQDSFYQNSLGLTGQLLRHVTQLTSIPSGASAARLVEIIPEFSIITKGKQIEFPIPFTEDTRATSSERILGERKMELDRLLVSLKILVLLLEGDHPAFDKFKSCQPDETSITFQTFSALSKVVCERLDTIEKQELLIKSLIYNTAAKSSSHDWIAYAQRTQNYDSLFESDEKSRLSIDIKKISDDHIDFLASLLQKDIGLFPSLSNMDPELKASYIEALRGPNLGQFLRLENIEASFSAYMELDSVAKDIHFVQFLCLVAGAKGHESENGSLILQENMARRFLLVSSALQEKTESGIYETILHKLAQKIEIDIATPEARTLTRVASMMGLELPDEAATLKKVFSSAAISDSERKLLLTELDNRGIDGKEALLLYHSPAFLSTILLSPATVSEGIEAGMTYSLKALARIFQLANDCFDRREVSGVRMLSVRELAATAIEDFENSLSSIEFNKQGETGSFSYSKRPPESLGEVIYEEDQHNSREPSAFISHTPLRLISSALDNLRIIGLSKIVAARGTPELAESFQNELSHTFHIASQIAIFNPKDSGFKQASDMSNTGSELDKLGSALDLLTTNFSPDFKTPLRLELFEALAKSRLKLTSLLERITQLAQIYDFRISKHENTWDISYHPSANSHGHIRFSFDQVSVNQSELSMKLSNFSKIIQIKDLNMSTLTPDEKMTLLQGFISIMGNHPLAYSTRHGALFNSNQENKFIQISSNESLNERHKMILTRLDQAEKALSVLSDSLTLTRKNGTDDSDDYIIKLMVQKNNILLLAQKLLVLPSLNLETKFHAAIDELLDTAKSNSKLEKGYTSVSPSNDRATADLAFEMAEISADNIYRPTDPRIFDLGGRIHLLSANLIEGMLQSGHRAITCHDENGHLVGYCLYIPSAYLSSFMPDISERYKSYGNPSFIRYIFVKPNNGSMLPVYELLTNRFRIDASNSSVVVGRILYENRRSLAANLSSLGKGTLFVGDLFAPQTNVPYPGYNSLAEAKRMKPNDTEARSQIPEIDELRTGDFSGFVAPILPAWWKFFADNHQGDSEAIEIATLICNRNLPSLFDRNLADLLTLCFKVSERELYLNGTDELGAPAKRNSRELKIKIPEWKHKVEEYLASVLPYSLDEIREIWSGDWLKIKELEIQWRPYVEEQNVRSLLNYF
jgi:hypothetical protein